MAQGIAEVKKLFETTNHRSVVPVRMAGEAEGVFFAVMDFFPGRTLAAWLKEPNNPLGLRRLVARRLVDDVCTLSHHDIYHGDLHTRNVLLDTRVASLLDGREPKLGIIDFGTSLFSSKGSSKARHWRVFTETLDQIVKPFHFRQLATTPFPSTSSPHAIQTWYQSCLISIRHVLIRLGAEWLMDGEDEHELWKTAWNGEKATRTAKIADIFPVPLHILETARDLVAEGAVTLSEECLGRGSLWWPT